MNSQNASEPIEEITKIQKRMAALQAMRIKDVSRVELQVIKLQDHMEFLVEEAMKHEEAERKIHEETHAELHLLICRTVLQLDIYEKAQVLH